MSIGTELLQKALNLGLDSTGMAAKFVIGNPIASRVAAGALIGQGISDFSKELHAKASEKTGAVGYARAAARIAAGGILAVFNDPEWYNQTGGTKYSTSLQYGYRRSFRPSRTRFAEVHALVLKNDMVVPYDPNLAMEKDLDAVFKTIMAINNRSSYYDRSTVKAYFTNMRNIIAEYTRLVRIYGLMNAINSMDSTLPMSILGAMGMTDATYVALSSNLAGFRTYLMQLARQISANYPIIGTYIARTSWLYASIYLDDANTKGVPIVIDLGKYTYARYELVGTDYKWQYHKRDAFDINLLANIPTLIANMQNFCLADFMTFPYADIFIADFLKAYGSDAFLQIDIPADNYVVPFVYSEEVSSIMENICSAHYGYVDADTGYSSTFDPTVTHTIASPALSILMPPETIRTYNGSPSFGWSTNPRISPNVSDQAHKQIEDRCVVNSPMVDTPVDVQIAFTRFTNCMKHGLAISSVRTTSQGNNQYIAEQPIGFYIDESQDSGYNCNSGDDIYRIIYCMSNTDRPQVMSINQLIIDSVDLFQNMPIEISNLAIPLDASGQTVRFMGANSFELMRIWSVIDWLPRLVFFNVEYTTTFNNNNVSVTIYSTELFDEKVFAPYPSTAKENFDTIANDSLYYCPVKIRTYSTEELPGPSKKGSTSKSDKSKKNKTNKKNRGKHPQSGRGNNGKGNSKGSKESNTTVDE